MPAHLSWANLPFLTKLGSSHLYRMPKSSRHWLSGIRRHSTLRPKGPGRPRNWPISTLKPESLLPSDYLNISGAQCVRLTFTNSSVKTAQRMYFQKEPKLPLASQASTRFLADSLGFFYCAPRPGLPLLASSVRFRCTPSSSPSSFAAGHDLLLPNGLPWQVLVGQAAVAYPSLRVALLHEKFLTPQSVAEWHTRLGKTHGGRITPAIVIFGLQQRFPVNFAGHLWLHVVPASTVPQRFAILRLTDVFSSRVGRKRFHPFVGTGHAQFEVSSEDPNILHLRIVKLMSPVSRAVNVPEKAVNRMLPREGELLYHRRKGDGTVKPWSFDLRVQNNNGTAMRLLTGRS
ncbi:hypothetical protein FB45DRAFT_1065441 [Roridomyces roridus]|uniref:Uncharacterized protein n=1 Tax=Roridomyces roridus TaxID=1738132 RepID=A0AAD7FCV5_9AGAR|nr:hypothetical protein FB45DRAFT_1065441 [Roridomyces roridus]